MKMVMELLRNSEGAPTTENLIILRNFEYRPKSLVSLKICVVLVYVACHALIRNS